MRTVSSPVEFAGRGLHLSRPDLKPRSMLVLANALSLSRGVAALSILMMSAVGASPIALFAIAVPMWLTDCLDGWVARRAWARGARRRLDGAVLDPLMDDVAFVCCFLVLLGAGVVPVWFVAVVLVTRVLFTLIRMLSLSDAEPTFALPLVVTKANGVVLAAGQILLLGHLSFPGTALGSDALVTAIVTTMLATTAYSVLRFAVRRHGKLLVRLFVP